MKKTLFENELKRALNLMQCSHKALTEGYIFDGSDDDYDYENDEQQEEPVGSNEDMENQNLSKYDSRINQMRDIALEGMKEYAEDVDDPMYQFFKKVFLECDKACKEKK